MLRFLTRKVDRDYYQRVHGFNCIPERVAHGVTGEVRLRYEEGFPLKADPTLDKAGVKIFARVDFTPDGFSSQNRIVFKQGGLESSVQCVHTALCVARPKDAFELVLDDGTRVVEMARSTEGWPVVLPPEEHFVSLRSYVAGVAELGLGNMLLASYHPGNPFDPSCVPFGFNSTMQRQVTVALKKLAPLAFDEFVRSVVLELVATVPVEWVIRRFNALDDLINVRSVLYSDLDRFKAMYDGVRHDPKPLLVDCAKYAGTASPLLDFLVDVTGEEKAEAEEVLTWVASNPNTTPHTLNRLASSRFWRVRKAVAAHSCSPKHVLERLSYDPCREVRLTLARNPSCPAAVLDGLFDQEGELDDDTLLLLVQHPRANENLLRKLRRTSNQLVRSKAHDRIEKTPSLVKMVVLGASGVGKTSLAKYFLENKVPEPPRVTIGLEFFSTLVEVEPEKFVKAQIWEISGAERFRFITPSFLFGAHGLILVYDASDPSTLENALERWQELPEEARRLPTVVLANKVDSLDQGVPQLLADQEKVVREVVKTAKFVPTSAANGRGVRDAFVLASKVASSHELDPKFVESMRKLRRRVDKALRIG
ncbi:MAG: hypothetical protein Kow0069_37180 [Promethearchaeota archaeon]